MAREKLLKIGLTSVFFTMCACSEGMSFSFRQKPPIEGWEKPRFLPTGTAGNMECWAPTSRNQLTKLPSDACKTQPR